MRVILVLVLALGAVDHVIQGVLQFPHLAFRRDIRDPRLKVARIDSPAKVDAPLYFCG